MDHNQTSPGAGGYTLGIDTGGTFTDAVLIASNDQQVVASAKVPTLHHDLAASVAGAAQAALEGSAINAGALELVAVSTTLATNALVEGTGQSAGLITLGFGENELERAGVLDALSPLDRLVHCAEGGHDAHGNARDGLETALDRIREAVGADAGGRGWAVASQFSVRNPAHERSVRAALSALGVESITCSHELSAKLGGPRRALTAFLNARLIGLIGDLIAAVESSMTALGFSAPVMVVRGDGSLVSAAFAKDRPIETILSGPAASVVGALHLADVDNAVISDIGGTTTDVALVRSGAALQGDEGAIVGGHRTMVEAVDMRTFGLGGDSEVVADPDGRPVPLRLGPQRAIPVSRLATDAGSIVHDFLDGALLSQTLSASDGRLLVSTGIEHSDAGDAREAEVLAAVADGPQRERAVAGNSLKLLALARLRSRGLVRVATMTPTDAAVLLDLVDAEDADLDFAAADKIGELLARQQDDAGGRIAENSRALAERVRNALVDASARAILTAALGWDGLDTAAATASDLVDRVLNARSGRSSAESSVVHVGVDLGMPLVAVGASAATWYPAVAELLGTSVVIPPHAEVANAVGAAVADVIVRGQLQITQPRKGQFRVHIEDQPTLATIEQAQQHAEAWIDAKLLADADRAGARQATLTREWDVVTATVGGRDVFVQATLTASASGRPATAR